MKITTKVVTEEHSHLDLNGYVINYVEVDRLVGKVLTLIETLGLPDKQESSFKDVIKQTIRKNIGSHSNTFITKELYDIVCFFNRELHNECIKQGKEVPEKSGASLRDGEYQLTFVSRY